MPIIHIDLRFVDVLYELRATGQYISSFEGQLLIIAEQEREKARIRIRQEGLDVDNGETDLIQQEIYDFTENILPRFFRSTILVTIWSIFEAAIIDVSKDLQSAKGKMLGIDDLRDKNFLECAKKYFKHILDFPLNGGKEWECLKMLQVLRNVIAHCNGRIDSCTKEKYRHLIEEWEKKNIGLSTEMGYLMFSKDFVEEIFKSINSFLTSLIADVKKAYPVKGAFNGNG